MTPEEIASIEYRFAVTLPDWYRRQLLVYPFPEPDESLYHDELSIVEANLEVQREGWHGHPWPPELFVIGDTGLGEPYFILPGTDDRRVFGLEEDEGLPPLLENLEQMVRAKSIEEHIKTERRAIRMMEKHEAERTRSPASKLLRSVSGMVLTALVAGGIIYAIYFLPSGPSNSELAASALPDVRWQFRELAYPPDAWPDRPLEEDLDPERLSAGISREFAGPKPFAEVAAWYRKRTEENGWKPYDERNWTDRHLDFCKAPYILELEEAPFLETRPDDHRFTLRLKWTRDFPEEWCPFPRE